MENTGNSPFEFIKKQIKNCNIDQTIESIKEQLKSEDSVQGRFNLILSMIIAKMSIQMLRSAISDCNSILTYEGSSIIFFLQGLSYLWMENEKEAIASWSEGIKRGGPISYFSIMNRLINDPNARAFFFSKKCDIVEILNFIENFDNTQIFTNSETHLAYSKLRTNSLNDAISHFTLILAHDPDNAEAIKGRGTAECFLTHWKKAIEDFTTLIRRNIDVESCTKFRAVSFAAIGNYTAAIDDFSTVIAMNPFDYHTISERGRLNMLRKSYKLALEDFTRNPRPDYDDKLYINFAECHYALGDLDKAREMIEKVKTTNHRSEYCYYLICRDSCKLVDAQKHLLNALTILPCFFLQRAEADFMYELGIYDQAVAFYQLALKKKENDSDTYRRYALSLFQSSTPIQALSILKTLHEGWVSQQNEIDLGLDTYHGLAIAGYYQDFYQPTPVEPLLQSASNDLYFIANFMNNYHGPLSSILRESPEKMKLRVNTHENGIKDEKNHDFDGIMNEFNFETYEPTPDEIKTITDASVLGKRVSINELESTVNQRTSRCYGFCVLYLAYFLRKLSKEIKTVSDEEKNDDDLVSFKKQPYWRDSIELIRPILTLIDLGKDVRWILDDKTGELHTEIAPTYYIQRGEKLSPKYKHAIHFVIRQFNSHLVDQISDIMTFDTIEDVFAVTQDEKTQIRPPFFCRGQNLEGPSINLNFLGTHGFDLFVRPPLDLDVMRHYEQLLQTIYLEIINGDSKSITSLSTFILLIWLYQPLSHYSVELGHIFYHAFILAFCNCESGKFISPFIKPKTQSENEPEQQAFMEMMVTPSESDFATKLINNFKTKRIEPTYSEASINYWEHEPTVDRLYRMIDYSLPK